MILKSLAIHVRQKTAASFPSNAYGLILIGKAIGARTFLVGIEVRTQDTRSLTFMI